jgi:two-component system cell cycle response regulator DivK
MLRFPTPTVLSVGLLASRGLCHGTMIPMSASITQEMPVSCAGDGTKILVVDDHEDTRCLLRTLLERRGLSVVEAVNGLEAVSAAVREQPDLILMDGGLPLLDGFAATRRLRGLAGLKAVPIVLLSGHVGPQYQRDARDAGCDDYVIKPFDIARLDTVLNRLLPHGRDRQEGN